MFREWAREHVHLGARVLLKVCSGTGIWENVCLGAGSRTRAFRHKSMINGVFRLRDVRKCVFRRRGAVIPVHWFGLKQHIHRRTAIGQGLREGLAKSLFRERVGEHVRLGARVVEKVRLGTMS